MELAQQVFAWLRPRLVPTLKLNLAATLKAQDDASSSRSRSYQAFPCR